MRLSPRITPALLDLDQGRSSRFSISCPLMTPPQSQSRAIALESSDAGVNVGSSARAFIELTKPRLSFFSILTAMATYGAASNQLGLQHALTTLIGVSLCAGGALSLNQWWERDLDSLMSRTRNRPLPKRRIPPGQALAFSLALSITGLCILALFISELAAFYAAATILIYGLVYTPLKKRTRWATEIGAISGALPPLIGSAAADVPSSPIGISLFLIILVWQMPHFHAIGWRFREDYQAAGFPLLAAIDDSGKRVAAWTFGYSILLLVLPVALYALDWVGLALLLVSLVAGADLCWSSFRFRKTLSDQHAHRLFISTIRYLPVVLIGCLIPN